ncbi:DUF6126 family protein [Streptomyces sp. NPDC102274]|uniref:DUF6126 family protein n=1 Tax=Streptomyces sp. NPDC102274 TaxID=3366151 RepID=UPI0037F51A47
MPESENPVSENPVSEKPAPGHVMKEEGKFPRGLVIRLVAYLIAGHLFAAFLYLVFEMGARG